MGNSRITPYVHKSGEARVMVTDGGPHPPEFWAQVTAEHVVPISPEMIGKRRMDALVLQAKIAEALVPHHTKVQDTERENIKANTDHHLQAAHPDHCADHAKEALTAIEAAAKGTEWEIHFTFGHDKPDWLDDRLKLIAERGEDNIPPLTPEQSAHYTKWARQEVIFNEVSRHFASVQHIERSWHADRLAGRA